MDNFATRMERRVSKTLFITCISYDNDILILDRFELSNITEMDLPDMSIVIVVLDRNRIRSNTPLGRVSIGPNGPKDNNHWEDMVKQGGEMVLMTHALREM